MKSAIIGMLSLALIPMVAGCASNQGTVAGTTPTLSPTEQALATEAENLGWTVACSYAKALGAKVKSPSALQASAIATVSSTCAGPAPTDLATAEQTLAQAAATFTTTLIAQ